MKEKPTFKEIRRLIRKCRNTQLFVNKIFTLSLYNTLQGIFLCIYFAFYCKGRTKLYRVRHERHQYMTAAAHRLLQMTQIVGWIEVRPFFSNELKSIVTMTIQQINGEDDKNLKVTAHLELFKKES